MVLIKEEEEEDSREWRESQEGADISIRVADSLCCIAETNTHCQAVILQ